MVEDLFRNVEDQTRLVSEMRQLTETPGWLTLQRVLDQNVTLLQEELATTEYTSENIHDLQRKQDRIRLFKYISGLPRELVETYTTHLDPFKASTDDPYEKSLPADESA